jgi:predicted DsbA family dithiol-disulfide isomerase
MEAALATFPHADSLTVTWHSFELDPTPTQDRRKFGTLNEMLAAKYGMTPAQAQAANARVTAVAAESGMTWDLALARPSASFDAHRLLHLAAAHSLQGPLMDRLMDGYFGEGLDLGDAPALSREAVQVGLSVDEVADVLASDRFTDEVRADERAASKLGVSGVPFFLLGGKYGVSGAQPVAAFGQALDQAWADEAARGA